MRTDVRAEWKSLQLSGEPRLIAGWRDSKGRRLDALRLKLHDGVSAELAELCQPALQRIQNDKERDFHPFGALDPKEYFWLEHSGLPSHVGESGADADTDPDDQADLVRLVRTVDALDEADREALESKKYTFYAICWSTQHGFVGFVTRVDPVAALSTGSKYFKYNNVVTSIDHPDLVLKPGADLVVGRDGTAILKAYAFENLFGDVGVVFLDVSKNMLKIARSLKGKIPLSKMARQSLETVAKNNHGIAKRLELIIPRVSAIELDALSFKKNLKARNVDPDLILNSDDEFSFSTENVSTFLDVIESRYYKDELGDEERRADRFSKRR